MDELRRTRPIDFLANDFAEIMDEVLASREPLYLVEGDQPRLVLLDAKTFADQEEKIALLKLLALGEKEIAQGKFRDVEEVFAELEQGDKK